MAIKTIIKCDGCGFEVLSQSSDVADKQIATEPFYKITFDVDRHTHIQRSVAGEKDLCSTCYNYLLDFLDTLVAYPKRKIAK